MCFRLHVVCVCLTVNITVTEGSLAAQSWMYNQLMSQSKGGHTYFNVITTNKIKEVCLNTEISSKIILVQQ